MRDRRITHAAQDAGFGIFRREAFRGRKTADTLYVLGSGASVATFTAAEWDRIGDADSLGMNFWLAHPFVSRFHQFETPRSDEHRDRMLALMAERASDYANTLFLFKDMDRRPMPAGALPEAWRGRVFVPRKFPLRAETEAAFEAELRLVRRLRLWERSDAMVQFRASLFEAVWFGLMMGYREIVLCGIDLTSPTYFWEVMEGVPKVYDTTGATLHRTADPAVHALPVDRVLEVLNHVVLGREGVTLSVARESSALYPRLPCHFGAD